mmetsp:Transcript_46477/g.88749  ORF Transcript_46477/g.88749 Transcript_46477/m.88749 type:complete len:100 (+) Transcript_46477:109-408(+)|eukprot:CAMPEP_0114233692 /NCGR_PEP_ID=MMETSP0058-20121206/5311_1 /TAXON_ID=36894 /ORGANISM="Pyramimonas parkeae, CCMP726" /LENGTH=99 /DNA_ID=CAMNT_0001345321 /DNA_START=91 /DNA_END=390 /DNA_ORIENTATION=-
MHTIVLLQMTQNTNTRTYLEFETVNLAMDGICQMFERRLKELNPNLRNITYDITDLYDFIDQLADMSCLVLNPQLNAYMPQNKEWMKKRAFQHLKKQAQ